MATVCQREHICPNIIGSKWQEREISSLGESRRFSSELSSMNLPKISQMISTGSLVKSKLCFGVSSLWRLRAIGVEGLKPRTPSAISDGYSIWNQPRGRSFCSKGIQKGDSPVDPTIIDGLQGIFLGNEVIAPARTSSVALPANMLSVFKENRWIRGKCTPEGEYDSCSSLDCVD